MYPAKMKIGGIRDISPVMIDWGEEDDLVLFGGVNGSGKSTLAFAMAYALGSDQIGVDTLRSKSLDLSREVWRAHIEVIFHNPPGSMAMDAPEWVSLGVEIVQKPNQQAFSSYFSKHGDTPSELSLFRKYRSRAEAREEFELKYGVAPDKFFMFWYQNSITRFATMKDRERFEYVAEMYGLKETQERWERAKTERKIAQEDFDRAKINLDKEKDQVTLAENRYNQWKQRNRLRLSGVQLRRKYFEEKGRLLNYQISRFEDRLQQLSVQCEEQEREILHGKEKIRLLTEEFERELEKRKDLEEEKRVDTTKRDKLNQDLERLRKERDELEKETREIEEKHRYVRPADLLQQLRSQLDQDLLDLRNDHVAMVEEWESLDKEIISEHQNKGKWESQLQQLQELLEEWNAYFQFTDSLDMLQKREREAENEYTEARQELEKLLGKIRLWDEELKELEQNKVLKHPQQVVSLEYYKQKQIMAYPFGELFEIHPNQTSEQVEYVLSGIKHALFICGPVQEAPTPLLHVSLTDEKIKKKEQGLFRKKLPGKPLNHFVSWSQLAYDLLTAKERETLANWVDQIHVITREMESIYVERGESYLLDGQLYGPLGQRGAFALGVAIGQKAWQDRIAWLKERLAESLAQQELFTELEEQAKEQWHISRESLKRYEERQSQMPLKEKEWKEIKAMLESLDKRLKEWEEQKKELSAEINTHLELRKEKELQRDQVNEELDIHRQFGEMAVMLDRLREVRRGMEEKGLARDHLTYHINDVDRSIQLCSEKMDKARQTQLTMNNELAHFEDALQKLKDDQEVMQRQKNGFMAEEEKRQEEEGLFREIYLELISTLPFYEPEPFESISEMRLKSWEDDSRRKLDEAEAMPVDEWAEEKYTAILDSYEKAQKETETAEQLFSRLLAEEEALRDHFRKTVYDRYQRINHHFQEYINRIGFRGKIEQVEPDESDPRRQHYEWKLYIATKTGHDLEYLRPTESIRQKIVSAPSGGEMAVISLMFALALLTDIEKRPPFYMLDEFDSALDEWRKGLVIDLYREVLGRKLMIISPKSHATDYLQRFSKFYAMVSDQKEKTRPVSRVLRLEREKYQALSKTFDEQTDDLAV